MQISIQVEWHTDRSLRKMGAAGMMEDNDDRSEIDTPSQVKTGFQPNVEDAANDD